MKTCKHCGDPIEPLDCCKELKKKDECQDCHREIAHKKLPKVTGPTAPPPGTGTVERQQHGRGKTNG